MPADYFPTRLFGFLTKEVDIERQTINGGTAVSGATDRISADGGGRVFAEFADGALVDRNVVLAWRALTGILEEGVNPVVVPFCDPRHQPGQPRRLAVPHSDGTPFDDESLYASIDGLVAEAAAATLRATTLVITGDLSGKTLLGGEWFAIEHATKGWRAYKVRRVPSQDETGATIEFRPPLREAIADGTTVDFENPRCLMVADMRPSTKIMFARHTDAQIRFVEAP